MTMMIENILKAFAIGSLMGAASAAPFDSANSGNWEVGTNWTPNGNPNPFADAITISTDSINWNGASDGYGGNTAAVIGGGASITVTGGGVLNVTSSQTYVGYVSAGTLDIQSGSLSPNGNLHVGRAGGNGTLIVGDGVGAAGDASIDVGGQLLLAAWNDAADVATITINGDGEILNARPALGGPAGSSATLTMNGDAYYQTTSRNAKQYIGSAGSGTIILNGSAEFERRSSGSSSFSIGGSSVGSGTIILNNGSFFNDTGNGNATSNGLQVGESGAGYFEINDTATVSLTSFLTAGYNASGSGTVVQNGGTVSTTRGIVLTRFGAGDGTYELNAGTLSTPVVHVGFSGTGTFLLDGGTLKTDQIIEGVQGGTGTFNWGDATLSVYSNQAEGSIDWSDSATGPVIRIGTELNVDGLNLATGASGGDSTLDLGALFNNGGVRFNNLHLTGALDLSAGGDTLTSIDNAYLLRPNVGLAEDFGSLPLVIADGGITDTFDVFVAPATDALGFTEFGGPFTTAAALPKNTWYLEYTATEILFHYRVEGTVPEPGTAGMLLMGVLFLRGLRQQPEAA